MSRLLDEMDHAQISLRIREARRQAGFRSRDDLADVMQVHPRTIENWENPKNPHVPYERMEELAGVLNVEKRWLLHGDEAPRSGSGDETLAEIARRLESLEAQVAESVAVTKEALRLLRAARRQAGAAPQSPRQANG